MRPLPYSCLTLLLIGVALLLYDRLQAGHAGATRADSTSLRLHIERLEARIAAVAARAGGSGAALPADEPSEAGGGADARLHAAPPGRGFSEATLARWRAGLGLLETQRLHEDERRYVERRLSELEPSWTSGERAAATRIVLDYFHAKAAWYRRIHAERIDPIGAQEKYDEIARAHHKRLRDALEDDYKARRVAYALMPPRR